MKTKEFIKRVEALGYKTSVDKYEVFVNDERNHLRARLGKENAYLNIITNDTPLIKLCIEYAETPIEEREEEKKYTVVLPDPRNEKDVMFMLTKRVGIAIIGWCHKAHVEGLTEAEIKRNHEYLWQFAKEVNND